MRADMWIFIDEILLKLIDAPTKKIKVMEGSK